MILFARVETVILQTTICAVNVTQMKIQTSFSHK